MALINFVVNLISVALWSAWLAGPSDPSTKTAGISLAGTLKRARGPSPKRWPYLVALLALLLVRGWFCFQISSIANWVPRLKFILVVLSFRGDLRLQMLVFTFLSFALVLAGFYLWLLLLSFGEIHEHEENPFIKLVHFHLKSLSRLPNGAKWLLPFLLGAAAWLALHPLLIRMTVVPPSRTSAQLFAQAVTIGLGTYLAWKYLIIALMFLYTLHSYVHLGDHSFWDFVDASARRLLRPFRMLPLQLGRIDLLPPLIILVVGLLAFAVDHPSENFVRRLFEWLPF